MPTTSPVPPEALKYLFDHVFLPPKLPQEEEDAQYSLLGNLTLCQQAHAVAIQFKPYLMGDQGTRWLSVLKLLANLVETTQVFGKEDSIKKILGLEVGDTLAFHIRAQNAGLLLRKNESYVIFEAFELAPPPGDVMSIQGKLRCSYPGPAIEVPLYIAQDCSFVEQLVAFLCQMDVDTLAGALPTTTKAASMVAESRSTVNPKYITQLLTAILHGVGQEANVQRTIKRYADEVCWYNARNPWRRSPFWLLLRVAVQRTCESREIYKGWMLLFHTHLLKMLSDNNYSTDLLHIARVKTGCRAYKLKGKASTPLLETVQQTCLVVEEQLQTRWLKYQQMQQASSYLHGSFPLTYQNETVLSLQSSRNYLSNVLSAKFDMVLAQSFHPQHKLRLRELDISDLYPDRLAMAIKDDPYTSLSDFELLIEERLDDWTSKNFAATSASQILEACFLQYFSSAKLLYKSNAEDQSIMILTLLDIWVALDKIACAQCPLLRAYSPVIPHSVLDPLLLRHSASLDRASSITTYLRHRHASAIPENPSIYSAKITSSSFAVCFYDSSGVLQDLMSSIVKRATSDRKAKCKELAEMNEEHKHLRQQIENMECSYIELTGRNGYTHIQHNKKCRKCKLEKRAATMRISVHEWPLPEGKLESKATVFELACPSIISVWRTLTYHVFRDIGMAHVDPASPTKVYLLHEYEGLKLWNSQAGSNRVTFGSQTKPFTKSHYRDPAIPSTENQICVNNGLQFRLYDKSYGEPVRECFDIDMHQHCTLRLPVKASPYSHLQHSVSYTTHSHNSTIVRQSDCPVNLDIHEYLAFSNLRCGAVLQWMNILREIRTKTLTFSSSEVHTLLMQAAWEIGPLSTGNIRLWHEELEIEEYGLSLVREASELLLYVSGNWTEANTVQTIIYLANRLAVSAKSIQVLNACSGLLCNARDVTHRWMRQISNKLQSASENEEAAIELQQQACEMAAICRATFDLYDNRQLHLLSSPEDFAILIECSIVVHDNMPTNLTDLSQEFQRLLDRDRRRRHRLEPITTKHIKNARRGIDAAIKLVWPTYDPGSQWVHLPEPNSRWITSSTHGARADNRSQIIHYNLLSGELLINGKPLGRLPHKMLSHPTYQRLFGQKFFDVIPANMDGMDYATRSTFRGFQVFFAFHQRDKERLIIRKRGLQSEHIFELVPHDVLSQDFPHFLTEDYTHWMDVHSGIIEFRPLNQLWARSPKNWHLNFSLTGSSTMFLEDGQISQRLIDIRCPTFQKMAAYLHPLEHAKYLVAVLRKESGAYRANVDLPRFRLSFFVNDEHQLESCNMQHMIIDTDQSSGTMIGLQNQMVLCHKDHDFEALPRSRLVIIPYGTVKSSLTPDGCHVCVTINTGGDSIRHVNWFKYDIDTDLGLLVGDLSLTSHLYKIYLHALCSHPLPDPLIGQRGTIYALEELGSARSFSFQQLTVPDVQLLRLIRDISPNRCYYPSHLQVMQTTEWCSHLPVLSQHRLFDTAVSKIMDHARSLTVFPELFVELPSWKPKSEPVLWERAARQAIFYQGERLSSTCDFSHQSRGSIHGSKGELEASKVSKLIYNWPTGIGRGDSGHPTILSIFEKWDSIKGTGEQISLAYSQEWLTLSINDHWLNIYEACRKMEDSRSKFELMFSFATLAYREERDIQQNLPILLACATLPPSQLGQCPQHDSYDLGEGYVPKEIRVASIVTAHTRSLEDSPVANLSRGDNETFRTFQRRRTRHYQELSQTKVNIAVNNLLAEWPNSNPRLSFANEAAGRGWFHTEEMMVQVKTYYQHCLNNGDLKEFASRVSKTLQGCATFLMDDYAVRQLEYSSLISMVSVSKLSPFTLDGVLLDRCTPAIPRTSGTFGVLSHQASQCCGHPIQTSGLAKLVDQFKLNHSSTLHQIYHHRLEQSQKQLEGQLVFTMPKECVPSTELCMTYRGQCRDRLIKIFESICHVLEPICIEEGIIKAVGLWPPISKRLLLQLLSTEGLGNWSDTLFALGEAYIEYQRSQRLVGFSLRSDVNNFYKELDNASFNWIDAKENPIWLSIQIQGNFLVRPLQSQIAREMITPSLQQSTALQLNMGEGKSHVIVPLVAAALADSQKLVRIVVLKSLANQMFQSLVERLAGLPNRRIFFLPFSRDVKPTSETIRNVCNLFQECARVKGVLVAQPEHILSFKLLVVDQILSFRSGTEAEVAQELQTAQAWMSSNSRDVLDESDELLHVRYQLIYTMDQQQQLDGGSDRWIRIQGIFDLVCRHMTVLHRRFPQEVELVEKDTSAGGKGHFPHFRLLGASAAIELVSLVAKDILNGELDTLTFVNLSPKSSLRPQLEHFMTSLHINAHTFDAVKNVYESTGLWKGLLLLRGLLAHGVLTYVLSSRRWRVDYGLDTKRSFLAVPFRAKDVPSLRSEFGHPDIIISLTCLTYYYGGLTSSQVKDCFEYVNKLDNPSLEYENWVKRGGSDVPQAIRQLRGVNMKDTDTFTNDVIPVFQYNKGTVDFYLSRVVFPKEAKEFPTKIGTSGWDLAEAKTHFTTGFSGTNDNADLLPTSIVQSDPVNQLKTNAQVLEYILREENDKYICMQGLNGQPCSAAKLLDAISRQPEEIRVLLDVGAQMLEMTNKKVVEHWLSLTSEQVQGGVFFDETDNLMIVTRSGLVEPLHSSPFLQRIDRCIVYLDDSHTRGTDIKFPPKFRAMVTLGPKVTKDKLAQGCMRMRCLGHGQTLVFCAPPEVDRQIRRVGNLDQCCPVQVVNVLCWAMSNTCSDIKDYIPHWVRQGLYYNIRRDGYTSFSLGDIQSLKTTWLEPAALTLDEMYGIGRKTTVDMDIIRSFPAMYNRLQEFGLTSVRDESMAEEQEREVSHEMEEEAQLERPPDVPPAVHRLDTEVLVFIRTGLISKNSIIFKPLLGPIVSAFHGTTNRLSGVARLLATRDFMSTTLINKEFYQLTDYMRPVNWIVSYVSPSDGSLFLIVMSPFEVNALLGDIRKSEYVQLHLYAPRTSDSMLSFDDLNIYCVPSLPLARNMATTVSLRSDMGALLNLWAGQLYFSDYATYQRVCLLLGLSSSEGCDDNSQAIDGAVESDRFIPPCGRVGEMARVCLFEQSPIPMLQRLFALRRKGMGFQATHMGKILQARLVLPRDFKD